MLFSVLVIKTHGCIRNTTEPKKKQLTQQEKLCKKKNAFCHMKN